MIKLYQFPSAWGLAGERQSSVHEAGDLAPIAGIPYEIEPFPSPTPPPKGKWPFIEDDGVLIGDSTLIVEHLRRTRGVDPIRA